jgi:Tol biopolymer transport system component
MGLIAAALTTGGCGASHHAERSAAGHILFATNRNGAWALYSMNPDGGAEKPVVNDVGRIEPGEGGYGTAVPKLSPDGRKVLLPRDGIAMLTLATGKTRQIVAAKASDEGSAVWSPDSRAIAYTDSNGRGIFVTDLRTGATHTVTKKANQPLSWSPDGKQILVLGVVSDAKTDLWVVRANGSGLRLLSDYVPVGDVSWQSDTQVEFGGIRNLDENRPARLVRVNLRTGTAAEVANLGYLDASAWSSDGRRFVYSGSAVYTMNADGSDRHRLPLPNLDPIDSQQLAWSPDGENIVAVRYGNFNKVGGGAMDQLWTIRADGSHRLQLTQPYPDGNENVVPLWTTSKVHGVALPTASQSRRGDGYVLRVPWRVDGVAASGARAVVIPHAGFNTPSSPLLVWKPGSDPLSLMGSFCGRIEQPALVGSRLAVDCGSNDGFYGEDSVVAFDLKTGVPRQLTGATSVNGPFVAGGRIEFESPGGDGVTLWRVAGSSRRAVLSTPGQTLIGAAPTRLVFQLEDERVMLTTASGAFVRVFDRSIQPPVLLAGPTLYELSGRQLKAFDAKSGALRWERDVPAHTHLQSGRGGEVVYAASPNVYVDSGTSRQTIHTRGHGLHTSLTSAGLFYSFNVKDARYPGRVVYVPRG